MEKILKDFPKGGPLDVYRKRASFDWRKLKLFLYTEEGLKYQNELYEEIQRTPIFSQPNVTPSFDEQRRIATIRCLTLRNMENVSIFKMFTNLRFPMILLTVMFQTDPSATVKESIAFKMFPSVIKSLGTDRHTKYFNQCFSGDIVGAYCLTEIGHGSNAKAMQTVATYDKNTEEFILHTPNFQSAKCWAGLLGQMATHAVVYAQLITPDGVNHSLHAFVVEIRDPKTLKPYAGVTVGDMGEKIGLNGVDNGFLMFNNYRIPRTALLNRTGDVSKDGVYVTPYKDPNKRYGAALGALSAGRVAITGICTIYMAHGLSIAVRYAAVRKQFGPDNDEIPILEYQSHQYRLIPYLAATYVFTVFSNYFLMTQYQFTIDTFLENSLDNLADLGLEIHALSSASKPVAGWIARDALQECREACAGHGYLKASGIGTLKDNNDANCTYEGENHVLIQQTSNWLLKMWPLILRDQTISSPLKSVDFLTDARVILNDRFSVATMEDFIKPEHILRMYKWLVCYLLKVSYEKCENLTKSDKLDSFWTKNESQVYFCKSLSIAYIQHFVMQQTLSDILEVTDSDVKNVLCRLLSLYGIWSLEKHVATFYEGGYATNPLLVKFMQDSVLKLSSELKDDAVSLVDVIAPPDFLINSVLGKSDGLVYKHLEATMLQAPGALSRPKWWKEITEWKQNINAKL